LKQQSFWSSSVILRNGGKLKPPVPVEKVLEKHLKLTLDFDDLHERLGIPRSGEEPDVLGALWADHWGVVATLIVVAPFIYPPWLTY
jgi:hypothetical protein